MFTAQSASLFLLFNVLNSVLKPCRRILCFIAQDTKGISTQTLKSLISERGQTFRSRSQLQDLRNNLEDQLEQKVRELQRSQGKSTPYALPLTLCKSTHTTHAHTLAQ